MLILEGLRLLSISIGTGFRRVALFRSRLVYLSLDVACWSGWKKHTG